VVIIIVSDLEDLLDEYSGGGLIVVFVFMLGIITLLQTIININHLDLFGLVFSLIIMTVWFSLGVYFRNDLNTKVDKTLEFEKAMGLNNYKW